MLGVGMNVWWKLSHGGGMWGCGVEGCGVWGGRWEVLFKGTLRPLAATCFSASWLTLSMGSFLHHVTLQCVISSTHGVLKVAGPGDQGLNL